VDQDQPGVYLEFQAPQRDLLTGLSTAHGVTWEDDRSSRDDRLAGVDDPRLNNFTAAAQALSRPASGRQPVAGR
jgi:hypothetical protein